MEDQFNEKGFSLIEIMIVVAILGILSSIAIPKYRAMQIRSKQSEAKIGLSKIYALERSFIAEWTYGTTNFGQLGYVPNGDLSYNIGWAGPHRKAIIHSSECTGDCDINTEDITKLPSAYQGSAAADDRDVNTSTFCNGLWGSSDQGSNNCSVDNANGSMNIKSISKSIVNKAGNVEFSIAAGANFKKGGLVPDQDQWTLNHKKQLNHKQRGKY